MKICLVQSDLVWADAALNRSRIEKQLSSVDRADIIILPEMFTTGFCTQDLELLDEDSTETLSWMKKLSEEKDAAVAGSIAVKDAGKYYNRFFFVEPDGTVGKYDKHHLFTYGGEDRYFEPGQERVTVCFRGWKILLQVCYDLRFPVSARNTDRYDMILYIASWPEKRRFAWDTLLRARAIENLSFVAGVNRIGTDPNCRYSGGTALLGFLGETLVSVPDNTEGVVCADISKDELMTYREHFPALDDMDRFEIKSSK